MIATPFMERRLLSELQQAMSAAAGRPIAWPQVIEAMELAFSLARRQILERYHRIVHVSEYPDLRLYAINELIAVMRGSTERRNPGLIGSAKQVAWAERIRSDHERTLRAYNPEAQLRRLFPTAGRGSVQTHGRTDPVATVLVALHAARYRISRIARARWFIDHRALSAAELIHAVNSYVGPTTDAS